MNTAIRSCAPSRLQVAAIAPRKRQTCHPSVIRWATGTGKAPADEKPTASQPATPTVDAKPPATQPGADAGAKPKGSWTPPYPSLVNHKPLPTEDVKTNIDM